MTERRHGTLYVAALTTIVVLVCVTLAIKAPVFKGTCIDGRAATMNGVSIFYQLDPNGHPQVCPS